MFLVTYNANNAKGTDIYPSMYLLIEGIMNGEDRCEVKEYMAGILSRAYKKCSHLQHAANMQPTCAPETTNLL